MPRKGKESCPILSASVRRGEQWTIWSEEGEHDRRDERRRENKGSLVEKDECRGLEEVRAEGGEEKEGAQEKRQ